MNCDDSAPVDFLICTSSSDSENFDQLTSPSSSYLERGKCPMCWKWKKSFVCTQCLLGGEFYFSNSSTNTVNQNVIKRRYAELKMNLLSLRCKRDELLKKCAYHTEPREKVAIIADQIEKCKSAIHLRKELKKTIEVRISNAQKESEILRLQSTKKRMDWPLYRSRLNNMQAQYGHKVLRFQKLKAHVQSRQALLKAGTKSRIVQMKQQVFPIYELDKPNRSINRSRDASLLLEDDEDETVNALMSATINSWGTSDEWASAGGSCYCIVGPSGPALPASGDYSDFDKWMDRTQGGMSTLPEHQKNLARDIPAALTYTTQFVNLIAYYLDLRLPHRLSYSAFTNGDMLNGKFSRKVAKLNANLIHLCASQGISPSLLQPRRTMANLVLLFNQDCDLGRRGPFEVGSKLAKSMKDSIEKDLVIYEDDSYESDTDWNDSNFPSDWENVQKGAISEEYGLQLMTDQSYFLSSTAYQSDIFTRSRNASMTGGLVSSVASFFRGWSSRSNY